MTIVGFEFRNNGNPNLLVFDPMFKISPAITRLLGTSARSADPARLLKAYRRGTPYLQKYKEFEILKCETQAKIVKALLIRLADYASQILRLVKKAHNTT